MVKIVLDTNILISAAIGKSYPYLIVNTVFTNTNSGLELCISENTLQEFERVAQYSKLIKKENFKINAKTIYDNIKIFGTFYTPQSLLHILKDKSDNKFLELALEAKAGYLITGDFMDFNIESVQGLKIVSAKIFWELYEQTNL